MSENESGIFDWAARTPVPRETRELMRQAVEEERIYAQPELRLWFARELGALLRYVDELEAKTSAKTRQGS